MNKEYETRRVDEIIPYEKNPRKNDAAVESVRKSIEQCGYIAPIVIDEDNIILAGHTRYKALLQMGTERADVVIVSGLSDEQKKKYRLLDNKTDELADWDFDLLKDELDGLDFGDLDLDWGIEKSGGGWNGSEEKPEVEFTQELLEENNYIVLFFDNAVDWLQAQTIFGLKTVQALDSRPGYEKKGIGRVVDGAEFLERMADYEN